VLRERGELRPALRPGGSHRYDLVEPASLFCVRSAREPCLRRPPPPGPPLGLGAEFVAAKRAAAKPSIRQRDGGALASGFAPTEQHEH
jgi:hypothetical protein